jgi:hypothetical protein
MHGPEKRVLIAIGNAALEGFPHLFGQRINRAVRVDGIDVVELERPFVARTHQRGNPVEYQATEESSLVLRTYGPLLGHWGDLAPS